MTAFDFKNKSYYSQRFNALNLPNQTLYSIEFEDCTFTECNFSDAIFNQCKFIDCSFINCNLSLVVIAHSQFNDVIFEHSKVIGVDWTKASWPNLSLFSPIKFQQCNMSDCSFFALELNQLVLDSCKVHEVDFRQGDFTQSNFSGSDFANSLFSQTNLTSVNFIEAINYHLDINNNIINKAKFSRHEAVNLLESLDIELVD